MTTFTIVAADTAQMGVTVKISGTKYWFNYLETLVDDAEISQTEADLWQELYDGYEMTWTFSAPKITVADQNITAACIMGATNYSDGGFCCGIMYVGNFSSQPEIWATWFSYDNYENWTEADGFSETVSDTENWRTESTSFTVTWEVNRWLPKEQRAVEFYQNEYRFQEGDSIVPFTYQFTADELFKKGDKGTAFTVVGALDGMATATFAVATVFAMLAN